ncbi:hypothetical protein [Nannocystis bainbridge]|uniref:Uncharacterized protein n=1 Tax=Nannocystis bainbridge TaxID=2995303 RepID=A0ABT5ECH9_9BACT|nr:hypothetical protein [Nannocystis bainbridge]MDC0723584.1 hypothetical protein [Nannocystis bainbridge]
MPAVASRMWRLSGRSGFGHGFGGSFCGGGGSGSTTVGACCDGSPRSGSDVVVVVVVVGRRTVGGCRDGFEPSTVGSGDVVVAELEVVESELLVVELESVGLEVFEAELGFEFEELEVLVVELELELVVVALGAGVRAKVISAPPPPTVCPIDQLWARARGAGGPAGTVTVVPAPTSGGRVPPPGGGASDGEEVGAPSGCVGGGRLGSNADIDDARGRVGMSVLGTSTTTVEEEVLTEVSILLGTGPPVDAQNRPPPIAAMLTVTSEPLMETVPPVEMSMPPG